jgi:hypothetical protein
MTPLFSWLAARLPRPVAVAVLTLAYAAMLFGLVIAGGSIEHNAYVDVNAAAQPAAARGAGAAPLHPEAGASP